MPITAALFDFGGVILSSPFEAFAHYERTNALPDGFIRGLNATNPDTNVWARFERSELTFDDFADAFEAEAIAAGHPIDAREVIALLGGRFRHEMVEAVRRCHEHLKTAVPLTNNVVGMDHDARFAEVFEHFDEVIESSKVGVRKPDVHFYEMACAALGIEPSEAVFLDDLGVNLKPAKALGMTTIKVHDADQAIADLEQVVGFALR